MCNLGVKNAMIVHGEDGIDEISLSASTFVCEVKDGWVRSYTITPEQFGFSRCKKEDLLGGSPAENAKILRAIFSGEKGAKQDAVVINAGAAMFTAGKFDSIEAAVSVAADVITGGKALSKLDEFVRLSNS
jgi:anthranilate phosphoribosyltransferase